MCSLFTVASGEVAIGDPTMGLVKYKVPGEAAGEYQLEPGSLVEPTDSTLPTFSLDSPVVFVVDSQHAESFEKFYHQIGNECAYNLMVIRERIGEIEDAVGLKVGCYWAGELTGEWSESNYQLDVHKLVRAD